MRVHIDTLSWRGLGIAQVDGRALVVPGTDAGEVVDITLAEDARGRRYGALDAVVEASPDRVDPACAQALKCPGCPLRHLSAMRQQAVKTAGHLGTLARLGGVRDLPVEHLPGPPADGHRARARARRVEVAGVARLGMVGLGDGIALAECPAQSRGSRDLLAVLEGVPAAFELEEIEVEGGPEGGQVVLTGAPAVVARVAEALPEGVTVLGSTPGPRGPSTPRRLRGPESGVIEVEGDVLRFTAPGWRPQSPLSLVALRAAVLRLLAPTEGDRVIEIGCGAGTLSLPLARQSHDLLGIDLERASVTDATHNAQGLANARFRVGPADHTLRRLLAGENRFDLALLHAMRLPFGPEVLPRLPVLGVRRALYLAPSAAALARDLAGSVGGSLRPSGDRSPSLVPLVTRFAPSVRLKATGLAFLDQLPGTVHLLTLAVLEEPVS